MGLGDVDLIDDGGGGGKELTAAAAAVSCSICLEVVMDDLVRSWAKLQCGHQFHLDCIGSAFNAKGIMQCPNCRKVEKGQWLYANRPIGEFSMDDWPHDEDLYDQNYSEMALGLHWCPFSGLTRLFDEGEYSSSAYHDYLAHQPVFAEHSTASSTSHMCPYIAYIGPAPAHPSSSTSSGSASDGSSFNIWNVPNEAAPTSYGFPSMDVHYHNDWDHSSSFPANNRVGGGSDQLSILSITQRSARNNNSEMPRPGMHPYMFAHSSASRAPTSVNSSAVPPYPGTVVRPRERAPTLQAYLQSTNNQASHAPHNGRRSGTHRGLPQVSAPVAPSTDQSSSGFYLFSSNSPGRNFQEPDSLLRNEQRYNGWEQEHQPSYPIPRIERDSIWGPFLPPVNGSGRSGQRYGSERMPSQYRS